MARILIIEDEPDVADLYRLTLEIEGHEVVAVHQDPREILPGRAETADSLPEPDLIILDERLKGLSGTEYLPRIRSTYPEARILVATADPDIGSWAVTNGADEVRHKPFTMQQLRENVASLLARLAPPDDG
jgi:two-component system response regulator VanR